MNLIEWEHQRLNDDACCRCDLPFAVLIVARAGDNFLRTDQSKPVLETHATSPAPHGAGDIVWRHG